LDSIISNESIEWFIDATAIRFMFEFRASIEIDSLLGVVIALN